MKFKCFTRARLVNNFDGEAFVGEKFITDDIIWVKVHSVTGVEEYRLNEGTAPVTRIYCGENIFTVMESVDDVMHILMEE